MHGHISLLTVDKATASDVYMACWTITRCVEAVWHINQQ